MSGEEITRHDRRQHERQVDDDIERLSADPFTGLGWSAAPPPTPPNEHSSGSR